MLDVVDFFFVLNSVVHGVLVAELSFSRNLDQSRSTEKICGGGPSAPRGRSVSTRGRARQTPECPHLLQDWSRSLPNSNEFPVERLCPPRGETKSPCWCFATVETKSNIDFTHSGFDSGAHQAKSLV